MSKNILVVLLIMISALFGCGSGGGTSTSGTSGQSQDPSSGPAVPGQQTKQTLTTALDGNIAGYLEYLPGDHATSNHTYPLIIFCHGLGELGDGSSASLDKVAYNGIPKLIRNNQFPTGFTVNNQTFSFIVVSPQFKSWPTANNIVALIDHLKTRGIRFDPKRVYVTGLSMGGGATWSAANSSASLPLIAAVVPVCGAQDSNDASAKRIADGHLAVWALHNNGDQTVTVNNTNHWIDAINKFNPTIPPRKTIFNVSGHDAWTQTYNPAYKEVFDGTPLNVYEWMLTHKKP